ncbi:hypothetical protein JFK97_20400 [Chromobacterium phragmitis]|uniref:hypothetical protein n=1 Tax=Chromobacterium amazonense TaxID=1382803 RepID=UPI0021B7B0E7|nr:hypothetical protein [Chromobacterium amazonense]MBM2886755.1 hypothetical protein [Chromobacterium amazonense]
MSKFIRALTAALGTYDVHEVNTEVEAVRLARNLADAGHAVAVWSSDGKWLVKA